MSDDYDAAYDPPRVSWQTDALYHVEHARRVLKEARRRAWEVVELRRQYDEQRLLAAEAARRKQAAEKAYWASPAGLAQTARYEAEVEEAKERLHRQDMARRKHRLPIWAEWAAWQWSVARRPQYRIGQELGGVLSSVVGVAIEDYLYLSLPEVAASWYRDCPLYFNSRQPRLRKHFKGRLEPLWPGRLVANEEPVPPPNPRTPEQFEQRNEWIYRQRLAGQSYKAIAGRLDMTSGGIRQICEKRERIDLRRRQSWSKPKPWRAPVNRGRPVDIDAAGGGPRDIWLTYRPSADPRLDNMEPVRP